MLSHAKNSSMSQENAVSKINDSIAFTVSKLYHLLFSNTVITKTDRGNGEAAHKALDLARYL